MLIVGYFNLFKQSLTLTAGTAAAASSAYSGLGIESKVDYEFNVWTKPDCEGTPYENPNR